MNMSKLIMRGWQPFLLVLFLTQGYAADAVFVPAEELPGAMANFTRQPLTVDGVLDEAAWQQAPPLHFSFITKKGGLKTEPKAGETRFLWTTEGMYVAFSAVDKTPTYGNIKQGDPVYQEDAFELFFDQVGDHRQYYEIQISPAGQVFIKVYVLTGEPELRPEGWFTADFAGRCMWRYDLPPPEGLKIASKRDANSGRWTLELFIPAEMAAKRQGGVMQPGVWRVNIARHDWDKPLGAADRKCKFMYWSPVLDGHPHQSPTLMGYLELKK